ncbi:MAG: DUF3575 domain-containing protein [Bacteroidaceae bacterium]|nr:DUF3575 domain-containing protein [Bacteroidaceae bacterium]
MLTICARAQMVAVKSDLVKDALMIPDAGVELVVGGRHTLGLSVFAATKPWGHNAEILGLSPRFRYWLSGRPFSRLFLGCATQIANYNIEWGKEKYNGNSISAGLLMGYAFNLSKRFNIELAWGTDIMYYSHKDHYLGDKFYEAGQRAESYGTIFTPRLEVSLLYIIR